MNFIFPFPSFLSTFSPSDGSRETEQRTFSSTEKHKINLLLIIASRFVVVCILSRLAAILFLIYLHFAKEDEKAKIIE